MAASKFANAPVQMENVVWGAPEREELKKKTITGTFPYLETPNGVLSEAYAIIQYLAATHNEKLNGANKSEQSTVNQWVQFAQNEITRYNKDLIYPILGFTEHNAADAQKANKEIVQWVKVLDAHLAGKSFIVGNAITLADLEMFFSLRFYMQLVFAEETRNLFPNVVAWFSKLMVNPHIVSCYGRTALCKVAQKAAVVQKMKLVGHKFSATVQRIMAVVKYANAPIVLENVNWGAPERETLKNNTQTGTFPYLETPNGTISETYAIIKYILNNFNTSMMGETPFQKAQINQWVEYSHQELSRHHKACLYPILGFLEFNKEESDKGLKEVKEFLKLLNVQLKGKKYLCGDKCSVADLELFFTTKFYFSLVFPEEVRKNMFPNVTSWFVSLAAEEQMMSAYGRTLLCKIPQKCPKIMFKKAEEKKVAEPKKAAEAKPAVAAEDKPEKKKANPLDILPAPKLVLDDFKKEFLNSKDQPAVLKNMFWPNYNDTDYSLYFMKYDKLPSEGKILFRTKNSMSMFLQKLSEFRKYTFSAHGIYGVEDNYDIKGVWMWRGVGVPQEFTQHESAEYMMLRKLDPTSEADRTLLESYWLNIDEGKMVDGSPVAYAETFK